MIEAAKSVSASRGRLRIAFYFFRLHMSSGGAERMLLALATDMAARGHEVHVVSWDWPDAEAFYPLPQTVQWHRLGFRQGWRDKLRRARALGRLLTQIRCQVFVGFVMSTDKTVYTGCLSAKVPIVVAERNSPAMYDLKFGGLTKAFYMGMFALADRVVVQLETYRQGYPRWLRARIDAIPNPVPCPVAIARPAERRPGGWLLLCVARLEWQKNVEALISAFAILAIDLPDWNLRVVGEGSLRPALERQVAELGLLERVTLPGAADDVEREYAGAHLFCLPSRWEGFPNALAEAMAHGLPAVGFAGCPGVDSMIDDGVDGLLAPGNGDARSLAAALRTLMADPARRAAMGEQARHLAHRFDAEHIADQWENLLWQTAKLGA